MQGGMNKSTGSQESTRMPNMNISQMTNYLKNIDYPADKQKIMDMAKSNGAPENVAQWLNKLPNKQYSSNSDVEREFSKMQ
jgi:hypothetical protein